MKETAHLTSKAHYYEEIGDYHKAENLLARAIAIKEAALGADHFELAEDYHNIGLLNLALNNHDQAQEFLVRALGLRRQHLGANHPDVLETLNSLALVQLEHDFAMTHW